MINSDQMVLARHCLGLPNETGRSYRNHYAAPIGGPTERAWDDLVAQGFAEKGRPREMLVGFCLTDRGARAVLMPGETLDPEDFRSAQPQS